MRTLVVDIEENGYPFQVANGEVFREEGNRKWIRFNRDEYSASDLISQISQLHNITDLTVEEPEIESIISRIYKEGYKVDEEPVGV
ncbi:hypothetical protein [Fredinandcohnia quinoae]|uniref:Uncharacterized protein n=1 Tax=Fredinandcohnia quinoae TaxID=2918902 RepID=A0AAW5E1L7_9BACI|nr:hypothetical protein [Fredinandcohnia sp. SECRCQ15]MCH1623997.1 hypothetical protein [Fredinandcohnia sp. SECRCQ15]